MPPHGTGEEVYRHAQRRTANGDNQGMLICDANGQPITVQALAVAETVLAWETLTS